MSDYVEEQIVRHEWTGNVDKISYGQLLVRCKDCKHGRPMITEDGIEVYCENNRIERIFCEQDWFCADGRKRDDT